MGDLLARIGRARLLVVAGAGVALVAAVGVAIGVMGDGGDDPVEQPATPAATPTAAPSATARPTATPEASATPIAHAGILDGVAMTDAEWAARKDLLPLAVMVDNTTGAYPHAGLDRADLVYEAFVEGGITRLMAVYWRQEAEKVLPVRSARTPFVIWASELAAMFGHAGGASTDNDANALGQIVEWGVKDLNAFSDVSGNYYFRDSDRSGPYDLATSTGYLRQAAAELGFAGPPSTPSWLFRTPGTPLPKGKPAEGIAVDFSGRMYSWQYIQWRWDPASHRYLRFQFGGPHLDAISNAQLAFATVVVMRAPTEVVDGAGHLLYEQLGSGPATVFTGGQAYEGTWKKEKREDRTRFYTAAGEEIVFERGPVFVELISTQSAFSFTAAAGDLPEMPEYEPPPPGSGPGPEDIEPTPSPVPTAAATPTVPPAPTSTPTPAPSPTATPTSPPTATPTLPVIIGE